MLKIIRNHWGQDIKTLNSSGYLSCKIETDLWARSLHLCSEELSKETTNLDSKAVKLAPGILVHATNLGAYRVAGVFPLDELRKLTAAQYIIKNSTAANHTNNY